MQREDQAMSQQDVDFVHMWISANVHQNDTADERAQELMEAVWVGAEMKAGAAFAHSTLTLDVIGRSSD